MCESSAYLINDSGQEELLMESVDYLKLDGGHVKLKNIFGEELSVDATLKEMHLSGHRIILERS